MRLLTMQSRIDLLQPCHHDYNSSLSTSLSLSLSFYLSPGSKWLLEKRRDSPRTGEGGGEFHFRSRPPQRTHARSSDTHTHSHTAPQLYIVHGWTASQPGRYVCVCNNLNRFHRESTCGSRIVTPRGVGGGRGGGTPPVPGLLTI